jgi:hypothetical protein
MRPKERETSAVQSPPLGRAPIGGSNAAHVLLVGRSSIESRTRPIQESSVSEQRREVNFRNSFSRLTCRRRKARAVRVLDCFWPSYSVAGGPASICIAVVVLYSVLGYRFGGTPWQRILHYVERGDCVVIGPCHAASNFMVCGGSPP